MKNAKKKKTGTGKTKSKNVSRQRANKKKVERRTKSDNRKTKKLTGRTANTKPVRSVKRGSGKRQDKLVKARKKGKSGEPKFRLTKAEQAILDELENLYQRDRKTERKLKKIKPAKAKKRWGKYHENLFSIDLSDYRTLQDKILAIIAEPFTNVERFLRSKPVEPNYVNVTTTDEDQETGEHYFHAYLSPGSMVVNAANTKQFILDTIVQHNDEMIEMVQAYDDSDARINELIGVSFRFLFPYND